MGVAIAITLVNSLNDIIANLSFDFAIGGSSKVKSEPTIGTLVASNSTSPGNKSNDDGYDRKLDKKTKTQKKIIK